MFVRVSATALTLTASILLAFAGCSSEPDPAPAPLDSPDRPSRDDGGASTPDASSTDASTPEPDGSAPPDPAIEEMHVRADRGLEALMLRYWSQLRDTDTYWTYAHDWDVVLDGAERRGPTAYTGTIRMFYESRNARGWDREFYDDLNWMVLTLVRAYDLSGDATYLTKARDIFADVMNGWDETCCGAHPGGIWWRKQKDSKATASNAGPVIAAARLYERTNEASYLAFAKKTFDYWATYMVDPKTGHVFDNISSKGELNTTWSFTYNEGLMIGAAVALTHADGDTSRIAVAHKIAGYMLDKETRPSSLGTILSDGPCGSPNGDDGELFKGIGIRYLAELYRVDPSHAEYKDIVVRSAMAAWTNARDPASGLISCDWAAPYDTDTDGVNSLASAAMTLAAAARVLGPGAQRPALAYEAEEANLHGVGLEANFAGFSGWGYVAGWGKNGQSVDVLVDLPTAGTYDVEFRYAAGDPAVRRVDVNGTTTTASFAFPSTGGYETYGTATGPLTLAAGKNTISVAYDGAQGSKGYLNLDRVRLVAK